MIWWPIIIMVAFYGAMFILDLRTIFYFEHPDDAKFTQGLVAKVVALAGLQLVWLLASGTPTDAFNAYVDGGMEFYIFWSVGYLFIVIYLVIPLPFSIYMYGADSDPRANKQPGWKRGLCMTAIFAGVAGALIGIGYALLTTATFNVTTTACSTMVASNAVASGDGTFRRQVFPEAASAAAKGFQTMNMPETTSCVTAGSTKFSTKVSFFTFLISLVSWIGYWFFFVHCGVGIVALPFDLIYGFVNRPKPMDLDKFKSRKKDLGERAAALKNAGQTIRQTEMALRDQSGCGVWRQKMQVKGEVKKFKQSVYLLENELDYLNISLKQRGENPAWSYTKLALGILAAIFSLLWLLHMVMFGAIAMHIPSVPGILNQIMIGIRKSGVYFLDLLFHGAFSLYLVTCCVKGVFKFGMRIFVFFPIHPVKKDSTRADSILFNVAMVVLSTCAMVHFSYQNFRDYCRGTALEYYFRAQGDNLPFTGFFYKNAIFTWLLLVVAVATGIWFGIRPKDTPAISKDYATLKPPKGVPVAAPPQAKQDEMAAEEDVDEAATAEGQPV